MLLPTLSLHYRGNILNQVKVTNGLLMTIWTINDLMTFVTDKLVAYTKPNLSSIMTII